MALVMEREDLDRFIWNTQDNDWLSYTEGAVRKILMESSNWTKDWSTLFIRILSRIKGKGGTADNPAINEKEKIVNLPLGKKHYMKVYFERQETGCLIYDFEIGKRIR